MKSILCCLLVFLLIIPLVSADIIMPVLPGFYGPNGVIYFILAIIIEGLIAWFLIKRVFNFSVSVKKVFVMILVANIVSLLVLFLIGMTGIGGILVWGAISYYGNSLIIGWPFVFILYLITFVIETFVFYQFIKKDSKKPLKNSIITSLIINMASYVLLLTLVFIYFG